MSDQPYNGQMITQYLLGSLAQADTERFDELSICDDRFVDALKEAENELVDAYVLGDLDDAKLGQFKSHYLASPLRREKVKFAQAVQSMGERSVPQSAGDRSTQVVESLAQRKRFRWLLSSLPALPVTLQHALVFATLLLLVVGGWLVFENMRLSRQISKTAASPVAGGERELQKQLEDQRRANASIEQDVVRLREERARLEQELASVREQHPMPEPRGSGPPDRLPSAGVIASLILAPQLRGNAQIPSVSITPATQNVWVQLELEPNSFSTYTVVLLDALGTHTLWRSKIVKARATDDNGILRVSLPARLLKSQVYLLRVTGFSASGAFEMLSDYSFKVVK